MCYGSSITQGGCASRPGMAYQNIISRHFDCDHINLGFSGSAKGEEANAEAMEGFAKEFEQLYREIMLNGKVVKFEAAKPAVDDMMNEIMGILACCVDGQDPATCTPHQEHSCDGSCSSCGGCH